MTAAVPVRANAGLRRCVQLSLLVGGWTVRAVQVLQGIRVDRRPEVDEPEMWRLLLAPHRIPCNAPSKAPKTKQNSKLQGTSWGAGLTVQAGEGHLHAPGAETAAGSQA